MNFQPFIILNLTLLHALLTLPYISHAEISQFDSLWQLSLSDLILLKTTSIATGTQTPLDKAASTTYNPQALMLINGIAITSLFSGNRNHVGGGVPVKPINRIEVISGPGSALYGADAFSGMINIITKNRETIWLQTGNSFGNTDTALSLEAEKTDGWKENIDEDAQNAGKRAGYGAELELTIPINETLKFYMNYAYQHSKNRTTHDNIGEALNHQAYLRNDWYVQNNWQLNSQINWVGQQSRASGDTQAPLDDYTNISLTLRHQNVNRPLSFKFAIKNLLNNNIAEVSQGPSSLPVAAILNDLPMAGRSLYSELQYDF
jgi:outer membrane receptor for ferrienterochelin and colicin